MKVSLNWLKEFIDIQDEPEKLADKLTFGGLEVEGIEKYESLPGGLKGVVIGEVKSCKKHPNADRLSLTSVDIGSGNESPIVCGAPNVAEGQKVLVATPGAFIYPINSEAFKIKKAKIRGEVSEGMICAEDELGLGENHEGIMVLDTDLPNGTPAAEYFKAYSDISIEIGLTPNRGDAASHLGVARDIKALYSKELKSFVPKDWPAKGEMKKLVVELLHPEACPRYAGIVINNLKVEESPSWLQNKLKAIGLSPINNIVDVTNFILHDLGQPLHAFDYDKISGSKVIVKHGLKGHKFKTLDEVERTLHEEDLMICNGNEPMCIGGVFGGIDSGVSETTTSIFLESACFDPVFIRKSSQRHGLKTDAAFRFERGTDIDMVISALKKAAVLLAEIAGGKIASELFDIYPEQAKAREVELKKSEIKRLIGVEIDHEEVIKILKNLDITLISDSDVAWKFEVPKYRTEVSRAADLIEEILRIYGFNNIPLSKNTGSEYLAPGDKGDYGQYEDIISDYLIGRNFNEILSNSLSNGEYDLRLEHFGSGYENAIILNKLSEELGVMRNNLLYSMLEVLRHNVNRKQKNLRLFELGFIYAKKGKAYHQKRALSIALSGQSNEESWLSENKAQNFFDLKSVLNGIAERIGLPMPGIKPGNYKFLKAGGFQINNDKAVIGWVGSIDDKMLKTFDLEQDAIIAGIELDKFIESGKKDILFKEIPKFPEVRRDLSLVLDEAISYDQIIAIAEKEGGSLIDRIGVFDVFKGKPLEKGKKSYAMSFILIDPEKTLEDKRIDKLMNNLIDKYEKELGAVIRR
ncbi:MAG: phenylalanine--tRNA ligase subunit beta [Cytophagales bacterium]